MGIHVHVHVSATRWYVQCTLLTVHHSVALSSHCSLYTTLLPCVCVSHTAHCTPICFLVLLFRNTVEKEEKKTLVQAGINVTDRVFTPEEVRTRLAYSSMPCQNTPYTVVASFLGSILRLFNISCWIDWEWTLGQGYTVVQCSTLAC